MRGLSVRKIRRTLVVIITLASLGYAAYQQSQPNSSPTSPSTPSSSQAPKSGSSELAVHALEMLEVKGKASWSDYRRSVFGDGWGKNGACNTREVIMKRDMPGALLSGQCKVMQGTLHDPYTGTEIAFQRGVTPNDSIQIDHVVALSDAWQKGAQDMTLEERIRFANDPLELLAVQGQANQDKGGSDASAWLPPFRPFRCQYVTRQIAVKKKYRLWVTVAEKDAMKRVLASCPNQSMLQD